MGDIQKFFLSAAALLIITGLLVTCAKRASANGWDYPTYTLGLAWAAENSFSMDDAAQGNPAGMFRLQHCYRTGREWLGVCYGYEHLSSAPLEDREVYHDMLFIGIGGKITGW